jgi:tryptophan synthase alpha chain
MTRIGTTFDRLKTEGRKGFIAYVTAGDPSLDDTVDIVRRLEDAGVDIVELGIPFSDPLADGRVNQESANRALEAGTTPTAVLDTIARLRETTELPIMCYTYLNPFLARGYGPMLRRAAKAGVDGLLFLDMPAEESGELLGLMHDAKLDNIVLVTPTSPEARIKAIVKNATGFVYAVSRVGVTGMQASVNQDIGRLVTMTRKASGLPVALGFGVSNPAMAAETARHADAVVVGSAIVNAFHKAGPTAKGRTLATAEVAAMVRAVKEINVP